MQRGALVAWAFIRMGLRATFSYPLSFILNQLSTVSTIAGLFFLGKLIHPSATLGSSYLTFATVGILGSYISTAGLLGLGQELDWAIQQGRLEMLLIEPMSWKLVPFALGAWPVLYRIFLAILLTLVAWGFGASFVVHQVAAAGAIIVFGAMSGLALGVAAGSIRVLAKRSDPLATLYSMVASVFSGQLFPIGLFPKDLRAISWFLPTTYVISGLRKALMSDSAAVYGPNPVEAAAALGLFCLVLLPISMWMFGRSLEEGRKYGVLAGY